MNIPPTGPSPDGLIDLARAEGRTLSASALRLTKIATEDGPCVSITVAGISLTFSGWSNCGVSTSALSATAMDATDLHILSGVLSGIADTLGLNKPTPDNETEF